MWIPNFPMGIGGTAAVGAGGMVILILIIGGVIHAAIAMAFVTACAWAAAFIVPRAAAGLGWTARFNAKGLRQTLTTAFIAWVLVTWGVDFIAKSYISPPMMVIALGRTECYPNCAWAGYSGVPFTVTSIGSYYAYAAGTGVLDVARYVLLLLPGTLAVAATLKLVPASAYAANDVLNVPMGDHGTWALDYTSQVFAGPAGWARLAAASALCTGIALFVVTPPFIWILIQGANLARNG